MTTADFSAPENGRGEALNPARIPTSARAHVLTIPDPQRIEVEQAAAVALQIEAWAETIDDVDALEWARARVSAIETYLRRRGEDAAAEIARADRKLEARIGLLLGPAKVGSNQYTEPSLASDGSLSLNQRHQFRKIAEHADEPEVAAAIGRGASRAEVLRTIQRVEDADIADESRRWLEENIPPPTDPDGDRFRARVWDSILEVERAAKAMAQWMPEQVHEAIRTEKLAHVRTQMVEGLRDSLVELMRYSKVAA